MNEMQAVEILACPNCRGPLRWSNKTFACVDCGRTYRMVGNVPVFLADEVEIQREHASNPIGAEFEEVLRDGAELVLNIGAGGTAMRYPNCIEFERKIFRNTDVVGDAHRLPFRDAVFDRVFAFNVFEHLREPNVAAAEIHRVLKPGGSAAIHTAFLQPLHEEPHHYYNATEFGVREWFSAFQIERCEISGNFGPGVMLAFLCANVMDAAEAGGIAAETQGEIAAVTIGEWAKAWRSGLTHVPPGFTALQNLAQPLQKRVAAGFQLIGRKPAAPR